MRKFKIVMKYLLAIAFIAAGLNHFANPELYLRIMPPYLPWPSALHLIAGIFEFVFGVMLLIPRLQWWAAWGLIALLLAIYPANIHMAVNNHLYPEFPMIYHWIRLPLQFVLIALAWWYSKTDEEKELKYEPGKNS
ncbi:MAG TPA: MauE/DoxX family redox-associated membrane protein [Blastocatellia bacterium]|nr:MauE/DoxX family redox-associated membrane protein [Blastocatellia bacterium]